MQKPLGREAQEVKTLQQNWKTLGSNHLWAPDRV